MVAELVYLLDLDRFRLLATQFFFVKKRPEYQDAELVAWKETTGHPSKLLSDASPILPGS